MRMLCEFQDFDVVKDKNEKEICAALRQYDRLLISTPEQLDDLKQQIAASIESINSNDKRMTKLEVNQRELTFFRLYRFTVTKGKHMVCSLTLLYIKDDYKIQ